MALTVPPFQVHSEMVTLVSSSRITSICGQHSLWSFVDSSAQQRENVAEPDTCSNEKIFSKARFK